MAMMIQVGSIYKDGAQAKWSVQVLVAMLFTIAIFALMAMPLDAIAQTTTTPTTGTGMSGDNIWVELKSTMFSGWGLAAAAGVVFCGIVVWMRKGITEGLLVMVAGFVIFLIPALVIAGRDFGKKWAGDTVSVEFHSPSQVVDGHVPVRDVA